MITSTTANATTIESGMAAPAFAAIGIGRNRIAAAGVITARAVITAWRTFSTPGRRPSPGCRALESAAGAVMSSPLDGPFQALGRAHASLGHAKRSDPNAGMSGFDITEWAARTPGQAGTLPTKAAH